VHLHLQLLPLLTANSLAFLALLPVALPITTVKVEVDVTLRLTVSRSVCLGVERTLGLVT
jgi:hypothetical protein